MDFFVKYDSGHVSVDVSSWYQRIKESKWCIDGQSVAGPLSLSLFHYHLIIIIL